MAKLHQNRADRNINIAVLYADADQEYWDQMERHIALLTKMHPNVRIWTVKDVELGTEISQRIREELQRADITLLLLSADFAIEEVFDSETRMLLQMYARQQGQRRYVMPIIVKDFLWQDHYDEQYDIEKLRFVDKIVRDPNPANREATYREITEMLGRYIDEISARAIQFVIPTWVGYIGGILYNNGFAKSKDTPLFQEYRRTLRFELNDDLEEMCTSFQAGNADLLWATLDRLPAVLHRLREYHPRVIFQASWSNGADCIITRNGIASVAELKGKKVVYPYNSPAFTFMRYVLRDHKLDPFDLVHQPQRPNDLDEVSRLFITDPSIDAVVIWSPYAEVCLDEVPGSQVIAHSGQYPNLIADVVVASADYVAINREELRELFSGWLRVTRDLQSSEEKEKNALEVLVKAILAPLPTIIPASIRTSLTDSLYHYFDASLDKVHLCSLADNQSFFGLGDAPPTGEALYRQFLELAFPQFLTDPTMQWDSIVDASFVRGLVEETTS